MCLLNENKTSLTASQFEFRRPDAAGVKVYFAVLVYPLIHPEG